MNPSQQKNQRCPAFEANTAYLKKIKFLLDDQQLGTLATFDGKIPHASIIGFAVSGDFRQIYFVTPRHTKKYSNLLNSGNAALLIDNRKNKPEDFQETSAVTVSGPVKELKGKNKEKALHVFCMRYPQLRDFIESAESAVFALDASNYRLVSRFQEVTEIFVN